MQSTKRSTFKLLFYLKKNAPKKNNMVPLMARITINGEVSQFSTKLDIRPDNWDLKFGRVPGKSREAQVINDKLSEIRLEIERIYSETLRKYGSISSEKLKHLFLGIDTAETTFLQFFLKHNEDFKKLVDNGTRALSTYRKYNRLYHLLKAYIEKSQKKADIAFTVLDHDFVQNFDFYLRKEGKLEHNTIWVYMIGFIKVIKTAIKRGKLSCNPFDEYENTKVSTDRGYLLKSELEAIIKHTPSNQDWILAKDLFLFSCFTGLSYVDIKKLEKKHIQQFFDGNTWIITRRQKTVNSSNVMLLELPKKIMAKYESFSKNDRIFPVPTNSICNTNIRKVIQEIESLQNKYVTFHTARHTFATLFLTEGVPLESLSKMMGHKNLQTTQIYAKILNEKVGRDMEKVAHTMNAMSGLLGE